ncbi:hypothetical protein H4CHR_00635 [Variovorax sp. PBS-H4]|uniref:hypothetical protein n=1 Tax=Variovorax sp. PBS-H4 TaxID=434008 RepID=UPI001316EAF6|nr:hypothetical protein [Variovorax sp. PBS-H4]VTU20688.1 hypothetical protein H4CHR_00635 [Variovorax sp. PBS-H4]
MSPKALRALFEIRLRWSDNLIQEEPRPRGGGLWVPDTPRNRERLDKAAALGNTLYGDQSHWIEKRQA